MRLQGSRLNQLILVALTIICALGAGFVIARVLGGSVPTMAVQLPPPDDTGALLEETSTVTQTIATDIAASEQAIVTETATIAPTATTVAAPSLAATSSPASAATAAPSPTDIFVDEDFETPTPTFPVTETLTWSTGYVGGRYQLKLNGQTNIRLVGDLPATDYRLDVDIRVSQGGAGVEFLAGDPQVSYRLLLTPDGAYSIERQEANTATKIKDWTENAAIQRGPEAINRIRVERVGAVISFFVNDQPLTTFDVPPGNFVNRYGFVLTARAGTGEASFDNLRGERLPDA